MLDRQPPAAGNQEYTALAATVREAGLLERRFGYYSLRIGSNLALLAAGVVAFVWLGDTWWQLVVAAFLAFVFAQLGFMGHDAGHRQVCRSRRMNDLVGLLHANLLTGFSYGWWVTKHNTHHVHTNLEGKDPDIGGGPVAFTADQARAKRGAARLLARSQAVLFLPLLLLEAINLHVASVKALRQRRGGAAATEVALLVVHAAVYVGAVLGVLSPVRALVFVIVNQGLFGFYLGLTFTTNHVGMPVLSQAEELSFLRRQVMTSRDIRGSAMLGFLCGGLNLQIEHHLFPTMPRVNLSRAQAIVRDFCAQHAIGYQENSVVSAWRDVFRYLHEVGGTVPGIG
ncbi:MAG TPA: acyl-CoA desaturase [Acidimicrobiales bacterium]|nr:acyl-CoA desaturase [Acidimicrobiales bacterium]